MVKHVTTRRSKRGNRLPITRRAYDAEELTWIKDSYSKPRLVNANDARWVKGLIRARRYHKNNNASMGAMMGYTTHTTKTPWGYYGYDPKRDS